MKPLKTLAGLALILIAAVGYMRRAEPAPGVPSTSATSFVPRALGPHDVAVPTTCTAQVNQGLSDLIASGTRQDIDNIMVCGVAIEKSRVQHGGQHGDHHVITVSAPMPSGQSVNVQVVINDDLDGVVTANANDAI